MSTDTPEFKLDPFVKEVWLEALRSGEYEQARESLVVYNDAYDNFDDYYDESACYYNTESPSSEVGYCCLGVLGKAFGLDDEDLRGNGFITSLMQFGAENINPIEDELSDLNDVENMSFLEIADHIEEHY
jgi:hypothetical protein